MRRIALVCDWYSPRRGGIETHLDGLATRLAARGHVVHLITSTPGPASVNGIPVHRLDVPRFPVRGAEVAVVPVAGAIARVLERERIEVVHSHVSIVAPVALAGGLAGHRLGLPSVVTFHSFVPGTRVWARLAGSLLGAGRWRAVMTAVSARVIREVETFAPRAEFSVLPNAIDTGFWTPGEVARTGNEVALIYAGRLQAKKRPLVLLRVVSDLLRSGVRFRLRVVGGGPLEARLRAGVARLGAGDRVQLIPWIDPAGLRELLRASDVFLSPAVRESFGIAALEARSVGLPVVGMRDSAVADFVVDGESGLLADDDAGFVEAVRRVAVDGALRERMAALNRSLLVGNGWEASLELHERLYGEASLSSRA